MSDETNFNRIKNVDRRLIRRDNIEEVREAVVRVDGKTFNLPRRLGRSRMARAFANSNGSIDSKAIDKMMDSTEDAKKLAVAIVKSLEPDIARKLTATVNSIEVRTGTDDDIERARAFSDVERDARISRRQSKKDSRRRERERSQPDVGGVYDAEYDDVRRV